MKFENMTGVVQLNKQGKEATLIMDSNQTMQKHEFKLSTFQRHSILIICFLLYMVNFMDRQVLSVVLEPLKLDLGLTDTQAGLLQTVFFLSMAFFAFPAAYLVDRWSRRKTLTLMAIVWSAFTYITGLGKSFLGVLLPRILVGVGEAGFPSAGTAMISAAYPEQARGRVLGIFNASIPLGAALGTILGGQLAQQGGWRTPFYVFAVPGVILGILAFFLKDYKTVKEVDDSGKRQKFLSSVSSLIRIRTLRFLYVGYAFQLAMNMAFIVWIPAFLMRAHNMTVAKAGLLMGSIGLMGIIGAPLGGIIADLWQKRNPRGRMYTPFIAALCGAVLMALTVFFEMKDVGYFIGILFGVFVIMPTPAVNSISQDVVPPGLRGLSWGMAGFIAMLGGAGWAPSAVGAISDGLGGGAYGLRVALMVMAVCGLIASLLFLVGSRHYPADMDRVKGIVLEAEKV
jgi:MFS family permease